MRNDAVIQKIEMLAHPLTALHDLDPLLECIGDAQYVLLGEASHGTREYYEWRNWISQRLIQEKGFSFIAVEGDWPECYEVNRCIKGYAYQNLESKYLLQKFTRWPSWMWANEEIVDLVEWLRAYNRNHTKKVGFYGLDVYSLWESLKAVLQYVKEHDPAHIEAARAAYECFEPYGDAERYARAAGFTSETCEDEVVTMLIDIRTKSRGYEKDPENYFNAEQNALVAKNAEHYYRTMIRGSQHSWNIRDRHMAETFERLMRLHGRDAKGIVWAHNTHVGDARATDMARTGTINLGQLIREQHKDEGVILVGFGSHHGSVIASEYWDGPIEHLTLPPARHNSWEDILSRTPPQNKLLIFDTAHTKDPDLSASRGHRAVGVVYHPQNEHGNYVPSSLPNRYNAFIFFDETTALNPLPIGRFTHKELPETYPSSY